MIKFAMDVIGADIDVCFSTPKDFKKIIILLDEITETINHKKGWSKYKVSTTLARQKDVYKKILLGENKIFVAKYKEEIVGLINMQIVYNLRHGWRRAHLEEVVVHSKYRGLGIGTKLINAVKNHCLSNKIKVIKLMCGNQLTDALAFYKKTALFLKIRGYDLSLNNIWAGTIYRGVRPKAERWIFLAVLSSQLK
jgi:ribosomal protein S18 acetylase RimI-like enzyme